MPLPALMSILDRLLVACRKVDLPTIMSILHELPIDYAPLSQEISDLLWCAEADSAEDHAAWPDIAVGAGARA